MLRKLTWATIASSLLLVVLASPVAAAPAMAIEVNAIPGVTIEICEGKKEVHARQPYGRITTWGPIDPPQQTWTIRKAAPGKCKGKLLGKFSATLEPDKHYSVVYWRPGKRVKMKIFETDRTIGTPGDSSLTIHHVAKVGKIDAWVWQQVKVPAAVGPTIRDITKGSATSPLQLPPNSMFVDVFPTKKTRKWKSASGGQDDVAPNTSYQAFVMGTKQRNMLVKLFPVPWNVPG